MKTDQGSAVPPKTTTTDILFEEGLRLVVDAAAAEGIAISAKTALRWCLAGVRGIRLENVKARGRRMTSRAAIRRFIAATQAANAVPSASAMDPASARRVIRGLGL